MEFVEKKKHWFERRKKFVWKFKNFNCKFDKLKLSIISERERKKDWKGRIFPGKQKSCQLIDDLAINKMKNEMEQFLLFMEFYSNLIQYQNLDERVISSD